MYFSTVLSPVQPGLTTLAACSTISATDTSQGSHARSTETRPYRSSSASALRTRSVERPLSNDIRSSSIGKMPHMCCAVFMYIASHRVFASGLRLRKSTELAKIVQSERIMRRLAPLDRRAASAPLF